MAARKRTPATAQPEKKMPDTGMEEKSIPDVKMETKELPAIGATEEFTGQLLKNLDTLMDKATGGKGKVDALDKMEQDRCELLSKLSELLAERETAPESRKESLERKILNTANRK